jgi:hypothetical protein
VRDKLLVLIMLQILVVSTTLHSTDLRGGVTGYSPLTNTWGPLGGVPIGLFVQARDGAFTVVRKAVTVSDGTYYLNGVPQGEYVLQVNGVNYPLKVTQTAMQDIPIIAIQARLSSPPSNPNSGQNAISADEAKQFVRDFFVMLSRNAATEQLLKAYAQPVKYYDRGTIDHDKLRQILEQNRFPSSKYDVESVDIIKLTPQEISQGFAVDAIRVKLSYHEKNPTNINQPKSFSETWVLQKANGNVQIVECQRPKEWRTKTH